MVNRRFSGILLRVAAAVLVGGGIIAVVVRLGDWLKTESPPDRTFAVSDIDCQPPPGLTREAFLAEVHYYAQLPERLDAGDPDLPKLLQTAFLRHPRVERVDSITIHGANRVRVELMFR